jgi:anthranilate phosphoribosyltransferase
VPTYEKKVYELDPAALGIPPCTIEDLKGGTIYQQTSTHRHRYAKAAAGRGSSPLLNHWDAEMMCSLGFGPGFLHSTCPEPLSLYALCGVSGDAEENAAMLREVLKGGPHHDAMRDAVVLNAGLSTGHRHFLDKSEDRSDVY